MTTTFKTLIILRDQEVNFWVMPIIYLHSVYIYVIRAIDQEVES